MELAGIGNVPKYSISRSASPGINLLILSGMPEWACGLTGGRGTRDDDIHLGWRVCAMDIGHGIGWWTARRTAACLGADVAVIDGALAETITTGGLTVGGLDITDSAAMLAISAEMLLVGDDGFSNAGTTTMAAGATLNINAVPTPSHLGSIQNNGWTVALGSVLSKAANILSPDRARQCDSLWTD
jgi:hypothetical protein